ncbi:hypothetical protein M0R45_031607 [Rubus argutus]|uniref:Peptide deformylase n=1 Tax=Rubus argutus TaxID=59490 RepID=A0AAW1WIQ3_RUBAR
METIHRFALRFVPISLAETTTPIFKRTRIPISSPGIVNPKPAFNTSLTGRKSYIPAPSPIAKAGYAEGSWGWSCCSTDWNSLRIIVLEDTKEYISYAPKDEIKVQDRRPFDLLVILNPKLQKKSNRTAVFFEGCLSVDGFRAVVERYLDVEVSGFDRNGHPSKIDASGWQARILQHECDHLGGTLYVDKMLPRTFRTVENLDLPLAEGCPKLGPKLGGH